MPTGELWARDLGEPVDPEAGSAHRARVVSPMRSSGPLRVVCPLTTTRRDHPWRIETEPEAATGLRHTSDVVTEHLRSISTARGVRRIGVVDPLTLAQVRGPPAATAPRVTRQRSSAQPSDEAVRLVLAGLPLVGEATSSSTSASSSMPSMPPPTTDGTSTPWSARETGTAPERTARWTRTAATSTRTASTTRRRAGSRGAARPTPRGSRDARGPAPPHGSAFLHDARVVGAERGRGSATAADGVRASIPLLVGAVPFGLVTGVSAVEAGLGPLGSTAWSVVVFAGAAQLAAYALIGSGASVVVVVATALVVNARFVLYSVSLAPHLAHLDRRRRLLAAYLLTDQAYLTAVVRYRDGLDPASRWRFYLGAGWSLWATWLVATLVGALVGGVLPDSLPLGFAVPLAFLAMLVPTITGRPTLVAALVGAAVAVVAAPLGSAALLLSALCGIGAGSALALRPGGGPSAPAAEDAP